MKRWCVLWAAVIFWVPTGCREAAKPKVQPMPVFPPGGGDGPAAAFQDSGQPPDVQKLNAALAKFKAHVRPDYTDPKLWIVSFPDGGSGPNPAELAELGPMLKGVAAAVSLHLVNDAITDADLVHVKDLNCLRNLGLNCPKITDAGLAHLSGLAGLKEVYMSNCPKITDAGMAHFAKLTQLRRLSIYSAKLTDAGLKHLAVLTELEELRFGDNEIDDAQLAQMKGMTKLKELSVGKMVTDAGMAHLKNLTGLRKLRIDGAKATAAGMANLAALKNLEELTILSSDALAGKGLSALPELTKLKRLEIIYSNVDLPAARDIAAVKSLERLRLGNATAESLKGIRDMTHLKELDLNYTLIDDDAAQHLSGLTSLKELDLSSTRVTNAGAKHLRGLTNLEWLSLISSSVTDDGLEHLAGMTKLKNLRLTECKIKGPGLKHLSGLKELQDLSLAGTSVGDASLLYLHGLTKLRDLNLTGTQVDDDAVIALKKAVPDMRICDASGEDVSLTKEAPPPPRKVPDLSKSPVDFNFTAATYAAEFKAGRDAARDKFKNKIIEVTGVVKDVTSNISGDAFIILDVGGKELLSGLNCFTASAQPWAKHAPGQKVKLRGQQSDWHDPTLIYTVVVEASENPAIIMTAEALAKEYSANPEAARKKYEGKMFQLSGEIAEKTLNSAGAADIRFKTEGKVQVSCGITAFERKMTKTLRVGRRVTMYGQFSAFRDEEVRLNFGLRIKKE